MPSILSDYELQLLHDVAEYGMSRVTTTNLQELQGISSCFADRCFDASYQLIRMRLYFGEYHRISSDSLRLLALELLRLNANA